MIVFKRFHTNKKPDQCVNFSGLPLNFAFIG
ncbi:hypothetical protein [Bacteroides phage LoVEphage]|nr:hypothetical protein [Bacteroides phage LoVEphage]